MTTTGLNSIVARSLKQPFDAAFEVQLIETGAATRRAVTVAP